MLSKSSACRPSKSSRTGMKEKLISGFKKLVVWQEAKNLTVLVYKLTDKFPKGEEYGLKSQMRRASVSVMSQIAEGWVRKSIKDKLHYLEIAEGSLLELESQGEIPTEVGYWTINDYNEFDSQRAKVSYLLYKYKSKIKENQ
jgi:four helix bundle protein